MPVTYDLRLWCNECSAAIGTVPAVDPRGSLERARHFMLGHIAQKHRPVPPPLQLPATFGRDVARSAGRRPRGAR